MICTSCGFEFSEQLPLCPRCATPAAAPGIPVAPPLEVFAVPGKSSPENSAPDAAGLPPIGTTMPGENTSDPHIEAHHSGARMDAAKHAAATHLANVANVAKKQAEAAGESLSGLAETAKKRVEEAGGVSGITDNAKKIAHKSAVGAKDFAGKTAVGAKSLAGRVADTVKANRKTTRFLVLIEIMLFVVAILLLCIQNVGDGAYVLCGILLFFCTAAFTVIAFMLIQRYNPESTPADEVSAHTDDNMQIASACGYIYMLSPTGTLYRTKNGSDKVEKLKITDIANIFADSNGLYACISDGSLVILPHGQESPDEIIPKGTILGNKAALIADGYIYFTSMKVSGNPICRVKSNGSAIQIITD